MCRFVAYVGAPKTLEEVLLTPEHALYRQAWAPRLQQRGTVNADGFGVAWYDSSIRAEPALYRNTAPMWSDRSFASMAGIIRSGAIMGAVRGATEPVISAEYNVPPFASGSYVFGHNGSIDGFRDGAASVLRRRLSQRRDSEIVGTTDSEVIFALVLDALDREVDPSTALVAAVTAVRETATARLTLILMDAQRIAAVRCGDSLFVKHDDDGTYVCSEPFDASGSWKEVDDLTVVDASADAVSVEALK